jgi:homoaconitase/3-isopropylmalate dehydratase large subunit
MGRDGHTCNHGAMDDAAAVIVIGDTDLELVRDSGELMQWHSQGRIIVD